MSQTHEGPGTEDRPPSTPRWVKVFGIIALVLILVVVVVLVFGGGPDGHGPGRHTSLSSVTEHSVQQL